MPLNIVILAAGQGKRMNSSTPKVLHKLGGIAMLQRVVNTASCLNPDGIHIIIGHGGDKVKEALPHLKVNWILQDKQLGTGHAVLQALPHIPKDSLVLILSADVPLIQAYTLEMLINLTKEDNKALALLLATINDPTGLGRITRNENNEVTAIVEEKDATEIQKQIKEIYSGICCTKAENLLKWLPRLTDSNAQKEYYLTEIIAHAIADKIDILSLEVNDHMEIFGVNDRLQLQLLERRWQRKVASDLMLKGVSIADQNRIDIRGELHCGKDVFIDVNTIFSGNVVIGDGSIIGANCILNEVTIGANCEIHPNSLLDNCQIDNGGQVGPFARLRPGTHLGVNSKIGNFVETKAAVFGENSKASHLSYLGDVTIGNDVNIGAGTITCNYDGANKHKTVIENGAFIGSDTQLVAPVSVGENATIGAGSTIRKNVPANELTLTLTTQKTIPGWKRPRKSESK